jgi:hypothetical protein
MVARSALATRKSDFIVIRGCSMGLNSNRYGGRKLERVAASTSVAATAALSADQRPALLLSLAFIEAVPRGRISPALEQVPARDHVALAGTLSLKRLSMKRNTG